jgi:glycosyltransferase involved in cell wall biosynthesis
MYRSFHAICQPSRGEGFGLVPLEALACGVPVIATACTGHAEVLATGPPGLQLVAHGNNVPMDDFPGSMAPQVTVESIREALVQAYASWESLDQRAAQNADSLRDDWTWEKKNGPAIRRMLQEAENVRQ